MKTDGTRLKSLDCKVIETSKRVLRLEHSFTLASMNNLTFTWKKIGRYVDAVELYIYRS
jgi:hypothetical protein